MRRTQKRGPGPSHLLLTPDHAGNVVFEAAQCARRRTSPDHPYYLQTAQRLGGNRACLAVSRKLLKRSYHTLRELGEEALQPA